MRMLCTLPAFTATTPKRRPCSPFPDPVAFRVRQTNSRGGMPLDGHATSGQTLSFNHHVSQSLRIQVVVATYGSTCPNLRAASVGIPGICTGGSGACQEDCFGCLLHVPRHGRCV